MDNTVEGTHYPRMRAWLTERDELRRKLQRRDALLREVIADKDRAEYGLGWKLVERIQKELDSK